MPFNIRPLPLNPGSTTSTGRGGGGRDNTTGRGGGGRDNSSTGRGGGGRTNTGNPVGNSSTPSGRPGTGHANTNTNVGHTGRPNPVYHTGPGSWNSGTVGGSGSGEWSSGAGGIGAGAGYNVGGGYNPGRGGSYGGTSGTGVRDSPSGSSSDINKDRVGHSRGEAPEALKAKLRGGSVGDYWAETKNAEMMQENSVNFVTPFKEPGKLEDLHLQQLMHTWEEIRREDGQFHYLLHEAPGGGGGGGMMGDGSGYSGIYSGTVQEIVWQYFIGKGHSKESTAGIMGNIQHESGFETDKIEAGTGIGFGLIQWSDIRRDAIEAYAAQNNKDILDVHFQLDYLYMELDGTTGNHWFATDVYSFSPYNYDFNEFKSTNDIEFAVNAFCWMFERPDERVAHLDRRIQSAHEYYNEFKDATFGGGFSGSATGLAKALVDECAKYNGGGYSQAVRYGPTYDCSSLMQTIYKDVAGVDIGASTHSQVPKHSDASFGQKIPINEVQPADLLYYFSGGVCFHVSMCIGPGYRSIFHAATPELGILYETNSGMEPDYGFRISQLMQGSNVQSGGRVNAGPARS